MYSILGVTMDLHYPTQFFEYYAKLYFVETCLGAEWFVKKKSFFFLPTEVFFFLPTVNACLSLTSLKACDWSGHIFGAILAPVPFYGGA